MSAESAPLAIIGAGPAGLMAAEIASAAGHAVTVYDAMPSVGRKFLLAGKSGLNLTHAGSLEHLLARFGPQRDRLASSLTAFDGAAVRAWAAGLGIDTFVGSSQRVFPLEMKAAPLLRSWLRRLRAQGVSLQMRHRWTGWNPAGELCFDTPHGSLTVRAEAVILALGGGSWARLGSDAAWVPWLRAAGLTVHPLRPANGGFERPWSPPFADRFAGAPVKPVAAWLQHGADASTPVRGEFVITRHGIEGSLVYALAAGLRDQIETQGYAELWLDLAPDRTQHALTAALQQDRRGQSLSNTLRRRCGLSPVKSGLLRENLGAECLGDGTRLAAAIKRLPVRLAATRPLDEAISSAGGLAFDELDAQFMVRQRPGLFCAGEMLDWEAPTGGYLLTACLATGRTAGLGAVAWLDARRAPHSA